MAGNIHILTSYGDSLMDTVCKDACSGHDVDKVSSQLPTPTMLLVICAV